MGTDSVCFNNSSWPQLKFESSSLLKKTWIQNILHVAAIRRVPFNDALCHHTHSSQQPKMKRSQHKGPPSSMSRRRPNANPHHENATAFINAAPHEKATA